jgi:hypothetical protein
MKFSATSHFTIGATASDFGMQMLGPQIDGQFTLPAK